MTWGVLAMLTLGQTLGGEGAKLTPRAVLDAFGEGFQNTDRMFPVTAALIGFGGALMVVTTLWIYRRRQQKELESGPMIAFHRAASQLGLNLKQQWLLVKISRQQTLPTPLTLMLSSATLEHHSARYLSQLGDSHRGHVQERVREIEQLLFGAK